MNYNSTKLKELFLNLVNKNVNKNINLYNSLDLKESNKSIKIATYNVRYWTDVNNKNRLNDTLSNILNINADIIFLQEVMVGSEYTLINGETINSKNIIETLNIKGYQIAFCNVLPTWFNGIYGNMMCIKKEIYNNFDVENITFEKSHKKCIVSGNINGTKETRCSIIANSDNLLICGIHLDICSELERIKQITQILNKLNIKKYKNKIQILLGDFNSTDINNYTDESIKNNIEHYVYNDVKKYKKHNIIKVLINNGFSYLKIPNNVTTWSFIQTDYIFVKIPYKLKKQFNLKNILQSTQLYYSDSSDHIPVFINI